MRTTASAKGTSDVSEIPSARSMTKGVWRGSKAARSLARPAPRGRDGNKGARRDELFHPLPPAPSSFLPSLRSSSHTTPCREHAFPLPLPTFSPHPWPAASLLVRVFPEPLQRHVLREAGVLRDLTTIQSSSIRSPSSRTRLANARLTSQNPLFLPPSTHGITTSFWTQVREKMTDWMEGSRLARIRG